MLTPETIRFDAAKNLERAAALLSLLEACERATGRRWVTEADRVQVRAAGKRWTYARQHGTVGPRRTRTAVTR